MVVQARQAQPVGIGVADSQLISFTSAEAKSVRANDSTKEGGGEGIECHFSYVKDAANRAPQEPAKIQQFSVFRIDSGCPAFLTSAQKKSTPSQAPFLCE